MTNAPAAFPRKVLLAVTGLSPQVVTETLYALAQNETPAFVPTEIHLITSSEGAERAELALLSGEPGWFHRLVRDYALAPIAFDRSHIHVVRNAQGEPVSDIRTPEDNLLCADFITEHVRNVTADPDSALHVSIAGGRKSMGFFAGYALSLFGREQDRLTHVLVTEPFESSWEFFYPTPYSRVIETRDRRLADTKNAVVTLADIPFVRLRHGMPEALLDGRANYERAVSAVQAGIGPASLRIELTERRVLAGGKGFKVPPAELALLTLFARRARANEPALAAPKKLVKDADWGERYLRELRLIAGPLGDLEKTERALDGGMDGDYFSQHLSKLRNVMQSELGRPAARPYLIDDGGTRPRRYRLEMPASAIEIVV